MDKTQGERVKRIKRVGRESLTLDSRVLANHRLIPSFEFTSVEGLNRLAPKILKIGNVCILIPRDH
jgi:hypothetical protein